MDRITMLAGAGIADLRPLGRPRTPARLSRYRTLPDPEGQETAMSLHAVALAEVLVGIHPDLAHFDHPLDVLLAHEEKY